MRDFEMCENQEVVLLCSSGMDSMLLTAVALEYGNIVHPLFVHWGFPWEDAEYKVLTNIVPAFCHANLRPVQKLTLSGASVYADSWMLNNEIPQWDSGATVRTNTILGRNVSLLALAFIYAAGKNINNVILGISGHAYPDAQDEFLKQYTGAMNLGMSTDIHLYCPLPSSDPEQIAEFVQQTRYIPWQLSFSCYNPIESTIPCGTCYKCTETRNKRMAWNIASPPSWEGNVYDK